MICFLEGVIEEQRPTGVTLKVGGVGYEIHIPLSSYDRLPGPGRPCRLLIHDWPREDSHDLYGFATPEERRIFRLLVGVGGIGPKTALNALSGMPPGDLAEAVVGGDVRRLSSIRGIGRKTAERIVVELRDRLADPGGGVPGEGGDTRLRDAAAALASLGYRPADAAQAVRAAARQANPQATVEEIVRLALQAGS